MLILVFLAVVVISWPAHARDDAYLAELIEDARKLMLSSDPQWLALVHYRNDRLGSGVTSEADDPLFFNDPRGAVDPQRELEATLATFFAEEVSGAKQEHPQCAFVARYTWLKGKLQFDAGRLPRQPCERFWNWYRRINPAGVTLIFPTAYMNNPSSMFGHTLLRIDAPGQTEKTRLLAYAINYGADTGSDGGLLFAVKGLTGVYPGFYSIAPYYKKVREYSDLENRDIWEYQLRLSPEEIRRLVMHVWELRGIHFDYYFFDENCSYELLTLLDVARPGLGLAEEFPVYVIPVDTIRVIRDRGLVEHVTFRPAASTRLRHGVSSLASPLQLLAAGLADRTVALEDPRITGLADTDAPGVLDVSYDYLQYEYLAGRRTREDAAPLSLQLLQMRSRLEQPDPVGPVPSPEVRPEQGHPTVLAAVGAGKESNRPFLSFRVRPAYHELLDSPDGYVDGAQINFLDLTLKYFTDNHRLVVDDATFVDILSLSPRDRFFRPISWMVRAGWARLPTTRAANTGDLTFQLQGGAGVTRRPGQRSLLFVLGKTALEANGDLGRGYAAGAGVEGGLVLNINSAWRVGLLGDYLRFGIGETYTRRSVALEQRVYLDSRNMLGFSLRSEQAGSETRRSGSLSWSYFF
jgi:Domain of unknown function (DUF4105)